MKNAKAPRIFKRVMIPKEESPVPANAMVGAIKNAMRIMAVDLGIDWSVLL